MPYFIADTDSIKNKEHFELLYSQMPPYRKEKIDSFIRYQDKLLSLLSGLTVRQALSECNIPNGDFLIQYSETGKPFLPNNPIFFSISHSEEKVLVATSHKPIGCDIEKIVDDDILSIAQQFFSPEEYHQLQNIIDKPKQLETFYKTWTTKEAIAKCTGHGLDDSILKSHDYSGYKLTFYNENGYFWTIAEKE